VVVVGRRVDLGLGAVLDLHAQGLGAAEGELDRDAGVLALEGARDLGEGIGEGGGRENEQLALGGIATTTPERETPQGQQGPSAANARHARP